MCEVGEGTGALLASAGQDASVKLWRVATGECVHALIGHASRVLGCCALGGGGGAPRVASCAADGTVRVWEAAGGECTRTLELEPTAQGPQVVRRCCSLAGGTQLAATGWCAADAASAPVPSAQPLLGVIFAFDVASGAEIARLRGHRSTVQALAALDARGVRLASGGDDLCVRVWDVPRAACTLVLDGHANDCVALCVLGPLGQGGDDCDGGGACGGGADDTRVRLASASADGTVRAYDV